MCRRIWIIVALLAACGCQRRTTLTPTTYETPAAQQGRQSELARQQNAQAIDLIRQGQLDEAEYVLKAALTADAFFGPAHNNLGTVYYRQKKYYLAAWEFQYACELMPTRAEPKNNLGMVFEAVGMMDEAAKHYEEALSLDEECLDATENLARLYVRQNRYDQKTRDLLREITLKDTRPLWTDWAQEKLVLMEVRQGPAGSQPAGGRTAPGPSSTEPREMGSQ